MDFKLKGFECATFHGLTRSFLFFQNTCVNKKYKKKKYVLTKTIIIPILSKWKRETNFHLKPMVYMVSAVKVAQIVRIALDWVCSKQNIGQFVSSLVRN
jgi:hypothetical protein